jgi:hypothetical protein
MILVLNVFYRVFNFFMLNVSVLQRNAFSNWILEAQKKIRHVNISNLDYLIYSHMENYST